MVRTEELNSVEYDVLILLRDNIEKSGKPELAERLNDFIIDNSLLIRDELPGDNFRMYMLQEY